MTSDKQVVISFSGGRTSAYLCYLAKQIFENPVFVFMDTGAEHPKTYDFVRKCNDYFDLNLICLRTVVNDTKNVGVGYKIISIDDIGCDLNPWSDMAGKYGLPYIGGAFCTDRMKTTPFKKYIYSTYGENAITWLGMRVDEPKRLGIKRGIKYLAEISDFEKQDVLDWWAKMPFDLDLPEHLGNCVFCIKKGVNKIALAAKDETELAANFIKMINADDVAIIETRTTPNNEMYRGSLSLESIIEIYAEFPRDKLAKTLRSSYESGSCSESCEAFSCGTQVDMFDDIDA